MIEGQITSPNCVVCVLSQDRQTLQKMLGELIRVMRAKFTPRIAREYLEETYSEVDPLRGWSEYIIPSQDIEDEILRLLSAEGDILESKDMHESALGDAWCVVMLSRKTLCSPLLSRERS